MPEGHLLARRCPGVAIFGWPSGMDPAAVANLGVFRYPDGALPVIGLRPSTAMTAATPVYVLMLMKTAIEYGKD
jgi:hypothetical protein